MLWIETQTFPGAGYSTYLEKLDICGNFIYEKWNVFKWVLSRMWIFCNINLNMLKVCRSYRSILKTNFSPRLRDKTDQSKSSWSLWTINTQPWDWNINIKNFSFHDCPCRDLHQVLCSDLYLRVDCGDINYVECWHKPQTSKYIKLIHTVGTLLRIDPSFRSQYLKERWNNSALSLLFFIKS